MPQIFCSRVVILERLWKDIDFLWDGLVARFCRQSRGRKEGRKEISILRSPAGAVSWFSSKFHHVSLNQWYSSRKDPITSHLVFWGPIIVQINPAANKIYGKSIETASFFFPSTLVPLCGLMDLHKHVCSSALIRCVCVHAFMRRKIVCLVSFRHC